MKHLVESILDADFIDKTEDQAADALVELSYMNTLFDFVKQFFEKQFKDCEFVHIDDLRKKYGRNVLRRRFSNRYVLIKDDVKENEWLTIYKKFEGQFIKFAKSTNKELFNQIVIDNDSEGQEIRFWPQHLKLEDGEAISAYILNCFYVEPGGRYMAFIPSTEEGGIKISIKKPK